MIGQFVLILLKQSFNDFLNQINRYIHIVAGLFGTNDIALYGNQKFISLDKENKGYVSITDLANIPEFSSHPLRYHIAQHMSDSKENDRIDFETFIKLLDIFKNNKTEEQYKFMYNLFDYDKDGKISSEDMLINFKLLLGSSLTEEQILEVIDKTISEYSTDQK